MHMALIGFLLASGVFMAMELEPGSLRGASGTIRYHRAFANV